jgi:hypothetical protein
VSHIWLGQFGPKAPRSYFDEQYETDDAALSLFGAEQGEQRYDHDWVEITYLDELQAVQLLVDGHSYSDAYLD